jgi:hypothetical protein
LFSLISIKKESISKNFSFEGICLFLLFSPFTSFATDKSVLTSSAGQKKCGKKYGEKTKKAVKIYFKNRRFLFFIWSTLSKKFIYSKKDTLYLKAIFSKSASKETE